MDKIWIDGVLHIADEEVIAKLNRLALNLDKLRTLLAPTRMCESLHHPANMRHTAGEQCPVEKAIQEALRP